jgi:hypothetical protein
MEKHDTRHPPALTTFRAGAYIKTLQDIMDITDDEFHIFKVSEILRNL